MNWDRLADTVRRRRLALGLTHEEVARRAGLTRVTISRIENSHQMSMRTVWKLDRGLAWKPGSGEEVLKGGQPVEEAQPAPVDLTDPDEAAIWAIQTLSEQRRREWIAEIRRERAAQSEGQDRLAE